MRVAGCRCWNTTQHTVDAEKCTYLATEAEHLKRVTALIEAPARPNMQASRTRPSEVCYSPNISQTSSISHNSSAGCMTPSSLPRPAQPLSSTEFACFFPTNLYINLSSSLSPHTHPHPHLPMRTPFSAIFTPSSPTSHPLSTPHSATPPPPGSLVGRVALTDGRGEVVRGNGVGACVFRVFAVRYSDVDLPLLLCIIPCRLVYRSIEVNIVTPR